MANDRGGEHDQARGREQITVEDPRLAWALERTFLAWIRTGVAMMGFGFVVARFGLFLRQLVLMGSTVAETPINASYVGAGMVALGVFVNVAATLRHRKMLRALSLNEPVVFELRLPMSVALITALAGAVLVATLVVGILR